MHTPYYAVIVAGGSGSRMDAPVPKQFLLLEGKPILMRTLGVFASLACQPKLVLVLPPNAFEGWGSLCNEHQFSIPHTLVPGGETRFHSVQNGLKSIDGSNGMVAIHDGVRPLVSSKVLEQCYNHAIEFGNAVSAINAVETVRLGTLNSSQHYKREDVWLVQTPQVFYLKQIKEFYECEWDKSFTDDASVAEAAGATINLVEGDRENIKITVPTDIPLAEAILRRRKSY